MKKLLALFIGSVLSLGLVLLISAREVISEDVSNMAGILLLAIISILIAVGKRK